MKMEKFRLGEALHFNGAGYSDKIQVEFEEVSVMIRLGIIGTGWITDQFIEACRGTGRYELAAVCSRSLEKAEKFAGKYGREVRCFDSLEDFMADGSFDTVYIASPNSLHFEQSVMAIDAGKNVIVEKPACTGMGQENRLLDLLAKRSDVHYFEAARHVHEKNFKVVAEAVGRLSKFQGAVLTYQKYSSRYDEFLAGGNPNVFTRKFAGGALQDLGVYMVYCAVSWFGMPDDAKYFPVMLRTGVDGSGTAVLKYRDADVILKIGKTSNSYLPGEIYGLRETIQLCNNSADLDAVYLVDGKGGRTLISSEPDENPMTAEALDFAEILEDGNSLEKKMMEQSWLDLSASVCSVMETLRESAGITFE